MILVVMVGLGLSECPHPQNSGFLGMTYCGFHPFPALPALQRLAPWGQPPIRQYLFELDPLTNLGQT